MNEEEMDPIAIEGKRVYWVVVWGVGVLVTRLDASTAHGIDKKKIKMATLSLSLPFVDRYCLSTLQLDLSFLCANLAYSKDH